MVTWKDSFEKMSNELELTRRKKQALDDMHSAGKISPNSYELLSKGLDDDIAQIEARQKALAEKMKNKMNELERQLNTLEIFLANAEMAYAAGETNEDLHKQETSALTLGLEATRQELDWIKEAISELMPDATMSPPETEVEAAETAPPKTENTLEESVAEETGDVEATETVPTETEVETEVLSEEMGEVAPQIPAEEPTELAQAAEEQVEESSETASEPPPEQSEIHTELPIEETTEHPIETTETPTEELPVEEGNDVPYKEESENLQPPEDTTEEEQN